MDEATFAAAGLYDPGAPAAADRLALLEYLVGLGATLEELTDSRDHGRLPALASDLARRGTDVRLTPREAAARAGIEFEDLEQLIRSAGLAAFDPNEPVFRPRDVAAFALFRAGVGLFGTEPTLEFTRALGAACAAMADSATALFGINVLGRFDEHAVSELEQARTRAFAATMLAEQVSDVIETLFFHHVDAAVLRSVAARSVDARTATYAVGFVDLVASTALNRQLGPGDLAQVIGGFERAAIEIVTGRGGRVVKTICDEVMFVNADAAAACDTALALRDAVSDDPRLGSVRSGLAYGDLVLGYGDFYGAEVNLAARLVRAAEPGQILATESLSVRAASPELAFTTVDGVVAAGFDDLVPTVSVERRLGTHR